MTGKSLSRRLGGWSLVVLLLCAVIGERTLAADDAAANARIAQQLREGTATVERGNPETAIRESFQPVIDGYDRKYRDETRRVFSASGPVESLYYLGIAATGPARRDALVVDGLWALALYQKAYALVDLERFDEAIGVLESLLVLAPRHPMAWSELGAIRQARGELDAAMTAYLEAEESAGLLDPKDPAQHPEYVRLMSRAWRGQGFVLIERNELDAAEELYRRCLELDGDDRGAKQELAYIAKLRQR